MCDLADEALRIDVWLWRARLCKTRAQAAAKAEDGLIRLCRDGRESRIARASHRVKAGDELTFALAGRVVAVRIAALGARRGPPAEARALYAPVDGAIDNAPAAHR